MFFQKGDIVMDDNKEFDDVVWMDRVMEQLSLEKAYFAGVSMGADGGIGSTYNFMADKFVKIQKLHAEGKMEEAKAVQQEANRIITVLIKIGVMAAEKEVLNQLGMDFGECRRPFSPCTEEQKQLIAKEIIPYI